MNFNCLICGKPSSATHMGMDACRACTVFYRRNRKIRDELMCITDNGACMENKRSIFACRRCRLERYETVMRSGFEDGILSTRPNSQSLPNFNIGSIEFDRMMRELIPQLEPQKSSIIDCIRVNIQHLSDFRCANELELLGFQSLSIDPKNQEYPLIHGTFQFMDEGMKILVDGLFKFTLSTFPEFRLLPHADKWLLIRNYAKLFHCIDGELKALRRFGMGSNTIFATYTTVLSAETVQYFFSNCLNAQIATEAARTLHGWMEEHIPKLDREIERVDPTDEEYFAMLGLALWSIENLDASDQLLTLASRYRTEIMAELTEKYRRTIGVEQGAIRIGMLMCLLQEFRRIVMTLQSNHAIYRMIGAVEENSITIQLPVK